jgi:DNA modification methylase
MTRPIVVRGDAAHLPLPDASVDLILTSPPYFALRSYTDGGQHYTGQIGSEPTPADYIAALVECTREWMRVLKPSGSAFINLGDKYAGGWGGGDPKSPGRQNGHGGPPGARAKSLLLLPERYRIACVDQLGLIARAVIVWAKPNGLPESVTDRVRRSHEDWVHLTRSPRYFAAVDEIREPHTGTSHPQRARQWVASTSGDRHRDCSTSSDQYNPLGKLPGSVWEVATEPLQVPAGVDVDHFAAFPSEWPRRLVLGWSPSGICTACGEGRRPVVETEKRLHRPSGEARIGTRYEESRNAGMRGDIGNVRSVHRMLGYVCSCAPYTDYRLSGEERPWREYHFHRWTPPPTRPATVLDPFGGTGTTAHVAAALGRIGITVDLSLDYSRLAAHPELADRRRRKVLGLDKPVLPVIPEGQLGFDWEDVS